MGEIVDGQPLFPGENETDQLHVIQDVLGPFQGILKSNIDRRKDCRNLKSREKPKQTLEKKYSHKIPHVAIDFMYKCLE